MDMKKELLAPRMAKTTLPIVTTVYNGLLHFLEDHTKTLSSATIRFTRF